MAEKAKRHWRVQLSEQHRAVIVLVAERFEGKRTEFRRMDRAVDIIDGDNELSDQISPTGMGISINMPTLDTVEKEFIFPNEPFKTLKNFLKDQPINYSRRRATIGRLFMDVLEAFDDAEEVTDVADG